jgi:beta-glucosidase
MSAEILRFPESFLWGSVCSSSRYEEQPELFKSPGVNAHRLSIEWSCLEPERGAWAGDAAEHYKAVLSSLKNRGITPLVTLRSRRLPLWLERLGGWESERAAETFETYARRAVRSFGADVQYWITADAQLSSAHFTRAGSVPSNVRSVGQVLRVYRNMIRAHVRAYHVMHDEAKELGVPAQVGVAENIRIFEPLRKDSVLDGFAAGLRDTFFNWHMLDSLHAGVVVYPFGFNRYVPEIERCFDFIEVDYLGPQTVRFKPGRAREFFGESIPLTESTGSDPGCDLRDEGLGLILANVSRFGKPVYITDNGTAADGPHERCRFIVSHVKQVYDAIQMGGDVRGYSLCLSRDDADTGGQLYRRICAQNGVPADLVQRYCPNAVW